MLWMTGVSNTSPHYLQMYTFGLCWILPVEHDYLAWSQNEYYSPDIDVGCLYTCDLGDRTVLQKIVGNPLCGAHRQWERGVADPDLPFSDDSDEAIDLSPRVSEASYDCEAQWSFPPFSASTCCSKELVEISLVPSAPSS
ncbi:hypothetical protein M758_4G020700 [Ceratodon purpureus]|nr:hypothetical protein M758_4G020700 [Ceratodon purpureus]